MVGSLGNHVPHFGKESSNTVFTKLDRDPEPSSEWFNSGQSFVGFWGSRINRTVGALPLRECTYITTSVHPLHVRMYCNP